MASDDIQLLAARAEDAAVAAASGDVKYLGFLGESGAYCARTAAQRARVELLLFGGFEDAERVYAAFLPDWFEKDDAEFPFGSVTFSFRKCDKLTHRDFLGSLMSLGIERDTVGDILIEDGRAVAFLDNGIIKHVLNNIDRIGKVGVTLCEGYQSPLPAAHTFLDMTDTVASSRIDCVVASLCNLSRAKAIELIDCAFVTVDGQTIKKSTFAVKNENRVTVRGYGKFLIEDITGISKKGRLILKSKKYV